MDSPPKSNCSFITVSLYDEDIAKLDELVAYLKTRAAKRASRSRVLKLGLYAMIAKDPNEVVRLLEAMPAGRPMPKR